jgi:YVTN family beta-propeller protein
MHSSPAEHRPGERTYYLRKFGIVATLLLVLALETGCGDTYRPVANPIIGQGGQPQAAHFAFVVNYNPIGSSSTTRIDVSGDTNLENQSVGAGALGESFLANSNGALFTANSLADSVSEFTTITTNAFVTSVNLPVGSKPVAITSRKPNFIYTLNSSSNANCPTTGSIGVINTTTLANTSTPCVGVNPVSFTQLPNGTKIYVANAGDNTISVYNPDLGVISATITQAMGLGLNPVFVLANFDSKYVFVVNQGDGVSPGSLNIITTIDDKIAATVPLGVGPTFAAIDTHLIRLYVVNTGGYSVTAFDISNIVVANNPPMPTLGTANVGSSPVSVTALADGTRFYTANSASNDVTVVSATSFGVLKTIAVGQDPVWIASDPGSSKVYTANKGSGNVSIIATVNDSLVSNMNAPQQDPNCASSCALQQPVMIRTF